MRARTLWLAMGLLSTLASSGCGQPERATSQPTAYDATPRFVRSTTLNLNGRALRPAHLQILSDSLYVSYEGEPRIDVYSLELGLLRSILLVTPEPVLPTSFVVTDSMILVSDRAKSVIAQYDQAGKFIDSFGMMPDEETRLSPLALTHFGGVAYVADSGQSRVLAVSLTDAPGITEKGELILSIPVRTEPALGFPSAVHVTSDGRLLVGDAKEGSIRAFTCDGRPIYDFEPVPDLAAMVPQGFAVDDRRDPSLTSPDRFDPTGLPEHGRIHVVDGFSGKIHMFNPVGEYIASYPSGARLQKPAGIAIDADRKRIFVADPPARKLFIFEYGGA